ncbi:MAG: ribosome biogenesis GTP-binding protein YihA/YsxC [Bdellovibrionales bacterium]|nr:ribosome biogenesis GTP-binding protein YihA/YsxC [Bdellovibrionales bacterium]
MASEYLITLADPGQIPTLLKRGFLNGRSEPRIAFVGRSNVGKSSLINSLLEQKIARVSSMPGKTKSIHFFLWQDQRKIVADLPGYGFAKVAQSEKNAWVRLLDSYFSADKALECVLLLFDSRHGPTDQDLEALEFFAKKGIPIQIVLTKIDQLKTQSERAKRKREILEVLSAFGVDDSDLAWVSVKDKKSIAMLRERLK